MRGPREALVLTFAFGRQRRDPRYLEPRIRWRDLLEFAFETQSLRKLCVNPQAAERQLGKVSAAILRKRLADLRAAANVNDVPIGKPTPMPGKGELGVDLGDHMLVFRANHAPVPMNSKRETDWDRVTRILFLRVEPKNSTGGERG